MAPDGHAGLTATDVHRWLRGLQWFHAARFAVMVAVVGATSVSIYAHPQCGPPNPFCGPSPQSTWGLALFLASLVLLIGAPGLGCLSALALGVLLAGYDPALSARGWWAAEAALSAAALVLLLLIRVHQHRVAPTIERRITLPGGGTPTAANWHGLRAQFMTTDDRAAFIGVAAAVGIVLMIIYQHEASASNEHLVHAVQTNAVVQYVDTGTSTSARYSIDLYLPDTNQFVTVDVPSEDDYRIDEIVPVVVDSTSRWLRLVARPDDQTSWLSFAILAWLLAAAAMLRPTRMWWAQRRPIDGDLRGILVSTRWPGPDVDAEISAADGSGLRLSVLRSPDVPARFIVEPDKVWTPPELVVVTGQLWYGGVVRLYALDGEPLADAIMGLPQLTLLRSWHAPPPASTVEDEDEFDGNAEPADSRAPMVIDGDGPPGSPALTPFAAYDGSHRLIRWTLWLYAVLAVGTVGFVVAGVLRSDSEWWALVILPGIVLLCLVPFLPHLARAHVAVSEDGVTVVNSWSTYRIPWSAIDKVELKLAQGQWQEWCSNTPQDDFQLVFSTPDRVIMAEVPVGPDAPTGGMAALVSRIVDYRDRTRVTDADPATAAKATGATTLWQRVRPPASDSLPPADIGRRVQDDATAIRVTGAAGQLPMVGPGVSAPLQPVDFAERIQDDVTASQPPNRWQAPVWSALRAVSFGTSGALLGAATYGSFVILSQHESGLTSMALGAIVAFSVGLAGAALRPLWIGAISVLLTLLSLLLSEYVIARQFGGLTHAPLVLSPNGTVTLIKDDLSSDPAVLWFWGMSLVFACYAPSLSRSGIGTVSARRKDAGTDRRPWHWIIGRGRWLAATAAFATGLMGLVVLAGVQLGPASQDRAPAAERDGFGHVAKGGSVPFPDVRVGDCYNNPQNNSFETLPEVPCHQPHDNEVFYIFTMSPGKYPGDDAVAASADQTCVDRLPDYIGDSPSAILDYGSFLPWDQLAWESGDRSVTCTLFRTDGEKLNGTTRAAR